MSRQLLSHAHLNKLARDFDHSPWTCLDGVLTRDEVHELARWCQQNRQSFVTSQIADRSTRDVHIRGDEIKWLEKGLHPLADHIMMRYEQSLPDLSEVLRQPLKSVEAHFAIYPTGRGYARHWDQKARTQPTESQRILSSVLYLNPAWSSQDGGQLRILDPQKPETTLVEFEPVAGRMVLFESATCLHEVRVANRERFSLTAWFRNR